MKVILVTATCVFYLLLIDHLYNKRLVQVVNQAAILEYIMNNTVEKYQNCMDRQREAKNANQNQSNTNPSGPNGDLWSR